jgi:hypothetical protein
MERTFERGLPHMLACVRPYDELADVHEASFFNELSAARGPASRTRRRVRAAAIRRPR